MSKDYFIILLIVCAVAGLAAFSFQKTTIPFINVSPREFFTSITNTFTTATTTTANDSTEQENSRNIQDTGAEKINSEKEEAAAVPLPKTSKVRYKVTVQSQWTAREFPAFFPSSDAHFSAPIVWSHNDKFNAFSVGAAASEGIESMAELGGTITLEKELNAARTYGMYAYTVGARQEPGENQEIILELRDGFTELSLVTMIAPSPDWFLAAEHINLFVDGAWVSELEIPLVLFDAGTEEGVDFSGKNQATVPKSVVAALDIVNTPTKPLATVVLTRLE